MGRHAVRAAARRRWKRLGDDAPASVHALTIDDLIEGIWKPYIRTLTDGPPTLLHGDRPHRQHVSAARRQGRVPGLAGGAPRQLRLDLGYFLQGALTTEDRRSQRARACSRRTATRSACRPTKCRRRDEIWLRYRASVAHGLTLWLCTASAGELWQRPDIALALARRYSAAYEDLQTADAIQSISA